MGRSEERLLALMRQSSASAMRRFWSDSVRAREKSWRRLAWSANSRGCKSDSNSAEFTESYSEVEACWKLAIVAAGRINSGP